MKLYLIYPPTDKTLFAIHRDRLVQGEVAWATTEGIRETCLKIKDQNGLEVHELIYGPTYKMSLETYKILTEWI